MSTATELQYICDEAGETVAVIVPISLWRKISSQQMELLLIEGLDSGDPIEVTEEWWNEKRDFLKRKLGSKPQ